MAEATHNNGSGNLASHSRDNSDDTPLRSDFVVALEFGLFVTLLVTFGWFSLRFIDIPVTGTDGGNLLAISRGLLGGDFDLLIQTQGPPLTALVYAITLPHGDWLPLNLLSVLCGLVLAIGLAAFVYRFTGNLLLAVVPVFVLGVSPVYWTQHTSLSPYAAFTALAYLGSWLAISYAIGRSGLRTGMVGAILLAASLYTFGQALAFFALPALALFVLSWHRETAVRLAQVYAALFVFTLPWMVWHLMVGGLGAFEDYPLNWLNQNYSDHIDWFWGRAYYESWPDYIAKVVSVLGRDLLPKWMWAIVPIGLVCTWMTYGWRYAVFAVLALIVLSAPVMMRTSPVFARYWYDCLPVLALLVTAAAQSAMRLMPPRSQMMIVSIVAMGLFGQAELAANDAYNWNVGRHNQRNADLELFASVIDDSRGIIARDSRIQAMAPKNPMFNNITLTESEMATYLSWMSSEDVRNVFERHGIGWVLLYNDTQRWEIDYNLWLQTSLGRYPKHYENIEVSGLVETAYRGNEMTLYKLVPMSGSGAEVLSLSTPEER